MKREVHVLRLRLFWRALGPALCMMSVVACNLNLGSEDKDKPAQGNAGEATDRQGATPKGYELSAIKTIRQETRVTILISEQFARPILPMIDRGYVIENGIPVLSGTGKELMDNPEVKAAYFGV